MTEPLTHPAPQPTAPRQLAWLESELDQWGAAGVVDDIQAEAIRGRYVAARRFSLTSLLLFLGGAFLGVGVLWLVAANLDQLSPVLRFVVATTLWLAFVVTAEAVAVRRGRRSPPGAGHSDPSIGTLRLLAVLTFGAVVFQAAQSLQVPAYEPALLGVWGLGALLYAYAVAAVAPLLVGIAATTGWYVWAVLDGGGEGFVLPVLPVLLAGVVAAAIAVLHAGRWRPSFAASWRESSALLTLLGLFVAAFPYVDAQGFDWSAPVVLGIVGAGAAVAAAAAVSTGRARLEALAPVGATVAGVLLVLWAPAEFDPSSVGVEGYAHAFVGVAVYVVAAGWYAVLGVLRDSARLTVLATAALVLFTTVQSFAVFAPIVTGAWLFLMLGLTLLGTGYLFDRGRRRLVANLEGAQA